MYVAGLSIPRLLLDSLAQNNYVFDGVWRRDFKHLWVNRLCLGRVAQGKSPPVRDQATLASTNLNIAIAIEVPGRRSEVT